MNLFSHFIQFRLVPEIVFQVFNSLCNALVIKFGLRLHDYKTKVFMEAKIASYLVSIQPVSCDDQKKVNSMWNVIPVLLQYCNGISE